MVTFVTKIDIYSGFLGAGKTTLIKKMLSEAYVGEKYSTPLSRMSYREIEKNVSNIPGDNEKILYAYKVMVEKLMASNAHVNASKTSREIAILHLLVRIFVVIKV